MAGCSSIKDIAISMARNSAVRTVVSDGKEQFLAFPSTRYAAPTPSLVFEPSVNISFIAEYLS